MITIRTASLAGFALFAAAAFAQTDQAPIRVVVDGDPIIFPNQQPTESNDRVLVPLRGVFEKLGATVDWDPSTQTITAQKRNSRVKLAIGQLDASVDGRPVHMDVPATLFGATTMVPLRFVSEALGAHVRWNAPAHEVDITRNADYDIPHPRNDRPVVIRPVDRRPRISILPADSVIPFTLNTRLSSRNAHAGDQFTAVLTTDASRYYFGLPAGTLAFGSVAYAHPRDRVNPGVIELRFDHLVLPNGRNLPVFGQLIGLDNLSVRRLPNGTFVAVSTERHDRVVWSGSGPGPGLVIGFHVGHKVADIELGGLLSGAMRMQPQRPQLHDVELVPGNKLGIRLYQDLAIPR